MPPGDQTGSADPLDLTGAEAPPAEPFARLRLIPLLPPDPLGAAKDPAPRPPKHRAH